MGEWGQNTLAFSLGLCQMAVYWKSAKWPFPQIPSADTNNRPWVHNTDGSLVRHITVQYCTVPNPCLLACRVPLLNPSQSACPHLGLFLGSWKAGNILYWSEQGYAQLLLHCLDCKSWGWALTGRWANLSRLGQIHTEEWGKAAQGHLIASGRD